MVFIDLANDRDSVAELRAFWKTALDQGITIGAFEADENNKISTLAGLNVLMVEDKDSDKTIVPIMVSLVFLYFFLAIYYKKKLCVLFRKRCREVKRFSISCTIFL